MLRLVCCARRVQLLVRRANRAGRDRRGDGSARAARDAIQQGSRDIGRRTFVRGVFVWLLLVGIVGLPYWIVLIPLHDLLLGNELRRELAHSRRSGSPSARSPPDISGRRSASGYDTMPDKELKQRARWDIYLLVLRAVAMFMMAAHGLYFILVPLMALLLSYFEIWPERVLGAVFGDPSRLWEYDPGDPTSNRRLP